MLAIDFDVSQIPASIDFLWKQTGSLNRGEKNPDHVTSLQNLLAKDIVQA